LFLQERSAASETGRTSDRVSTLKAPAARRCARCTATGASTLHSLPPGDHRVLFAMGENTTGPAVLWGPAGVPGEGIANAQCDQAGQRQALATSRPLAAPGKPSPPRVPPAECDLRENQQPAGADPYGGGGSPGHCPSAGRSRTLPAHPWDGLRSYVKATSGPRQALPVFFDLEIGCRSRVVRAPPCRSTRRCWGRRRGPCCSWSWVHGGSNMGAAGSGCGRFSSAIRHWPAHGLLSGSE